MGANSDVDVFSFTTAGPSNLRIAVEGAAQGQNLDAVIELYDASGTLVALSNPGDSLDAAVVRQVSGTHYVAVRSNGLYGRIGQYTITVSETTESLAQVRVTSSPALYTTSESGRQEWFTIVLESRPSGDVAFTVISSDPNEGSVSTGAVVFTPDNWFTPQTVTITGVDDGIIDGDAAYTVSIAPALSADPVYNGQFDPPDFALVNLDNDAPGYLYWIDSRIDAVQRSTLSGEHAETLVDLKALFGGTDANHNPVGIALDPVGGKMYWTDSTSDTIRRANLDGSNVETLVTGQTGVGAIAVDSAAGKIYWGDATANKIRRANLNGTGVEDVVTTGADDVREIALELTIGKLYWTDSAAFAIRRANLDGTQSELVISDGVHSPGTLELDVAAGKIYFSYRSFTPENQRVEELYRVNLDGTGVERVLDLTALGLPVSTPLGLTIDPSAGKLYWAGFSTKSIYAASLDGSNVVAVVEGEDVPLGFDPTGLSRPTGVAILLPTPGISVTPSGGLVTAEAGGTATFSVVLNAAPTADVIIELSVSDATEGSLSHSSLTFTAENWNAPQVVTVTGVDDSVYDGNDANRKVYVYNTSGGLLGSWTAGTLPSKANVQGIATNGTDVWIVDAQSDKVYRYTGAATRLSGSQNAASSFNLNSGNRNATGIEVAGNNLWIVNDTSTNKVFKYTLIGSLVGSWTISGANTTPTGITLDPSNPSDIWIIDSGTDRIYQYTAAANRTSGSQSPVASFALAAGNANPQGLADPPASGTGDRSSDAPRGRTWLRGIDHTVGDAGRVAPVDAGRVDYVTPRVRQASSTEVPPGEESRTERSTPRKGAARNASSQDRLTLLDEVFRNDLSWLA